MPTRRRTLALAGGFLTFLGGCVAESEPTATESTPTSNRAGSPEPTPAETSTGVTALVEDLPTWEPDRWIETDYTHALGLTLGNDRIFTTLGSDGNGQSAVAALDPGASGFTWRTPIDGDAQSDSYVKGRHWSDSWGVIVGDGTVYSVHGNSRDYEWTAVHALDATSGDERWSFRRERALRVAGFLGDLVVVAGEEFFEPDHTHDTPEEPLRTVVYGLDRTSGDQRWSIPVDGLSRLAVGADGVYAASGSTLAAYDSAGEERWERETTGAVDFLWAIDGTVVASVGPSPDESSLVGLTTGGEQSWTVDFSTRFALSGDDRVYVMNDEVAAVTADGSVAWRADRRGSQPMLSTDGDRLYTRTGRGTDAVDAYDLPGGDRQFRLRTRADNGWPLADTGATLVAGVRTPHKAESTSLYAADVDSGEPSAVYRPDEIVFTALGHAGEVYAAFGDGRIGVFGDI